MKLDEHTGSKLEVLRPAFVAVAAQQRSFCVPTAWCPSSLLAGEQPACPQLCLLNHMPSAMLVARMNVARCLLPHIASLSLV